MGVLVASLRGCPSPSKLGQRKVVDLVASPVIEDSTHARGPLAHWRGYGATLGLEPWKLTGPLAVKLTRYSIL